MKAYAIVVFVVTSLLAGCATSIEQLPLDSGFMPGRGQSFVLMKEISVSLPTGYASTLNRDSRWKLVGSIKRGDIYETSDQVVTLQASDMHEAYIVVKDGYLVGFYLPVEKTFAPASRVKLKTS